MSDTTNDFFWWKKKKDNHENIFAYINHIEKTQSYKRLANRRHMRLYGNVPSAQTNPMHSTTASSSFFPDTSQGMNIKHRVTLNIVQSMIDTVVSKITKNRPRPSFLTDGGDWSLQRKAKKLTKFVEGQFHCMDLYAKGTRAFQDACISGTGAIKFFVDQESNKIKSERVMIDEIVVDDVEAMHGEPRQIHQIKFIHKDVLKEMFPKKKHMIDMLSTDKGANSSFPAITTSDMVCVVESWHLPSGPDASDGLRVISIENDTLLKEEYMKPYFPFVFLRWGIRPIGFMGQGLAEQLSGLQLEINKILKTIQISMHLVSIPKILVEASSKIVSTHLDNKIGGIIKYAGTRPEFGPLGKIPPDLFSHLDRLYQRAFEIAGISQLSSQAKKPSGLDSGKALREFSDIESERFMDVSKRYEESYLEISKILIDLAKELGEKTDDFKVKVKGGKFMQTIKWSEVDIEEEKYLMQIFPTSSLSQTPAGRLQDVQELLQAGFISPEDGKKLLDFPDLEAFYNMENAAEEDIDRAIEFMIDKNEYQTPEPFQNLELGVVKMQQAYLHFRQQGAPESRLELFRRWIDDANALITKVAEELANREAQAMAAANPPPPAPVPIAQPEAAPVSDILPAVAGPTQ